MAPNQDEGKAEWIRLRQRLTGERGCAFFAGEYERLLADPRIATLEVSDGTVSLETAPVAWKGDVEILGGTEPLQVHLGRYSVVVAADAGGATMQVKCIESGRHDGQLIRPNLFPNNSNYPFGFCFGIRREYIEQLLAQGEYYGLICSVLECLWHINKGTTLIDLDPYCRAADQELIGPSNKPQLTGAATWTGRILQGCIRIISVIRSYLSARAA